MTPRERINLKQLHLANRQLRASSFELYCKILARLFDSFREYEFLKPASDALRARDWPNFYTHADSLSKQKYLDATQHFVANQFALLVKKYPWDSTLIGRDPLKKAVDDFQRAEKRCGDINKKFKILSIDPSRDKFREVSKKAMRWLRSTIGSTPDYSRILSECDYGSGASLGVHGDATHLIRKLSSEQVWTVGAGALHHAFGGLLKNAQYLEVLRERPSGERYGMVCYDYEEAFKSYLARISVVNYNKLSFVAKTAATHRAIAVEPLLSGFVQKGIDSVLRKKLSRVGIDLSDQSLNQRMAREGSFDDLDGFVTIDLRGASNSNALGPVEYLYPSDWVRLLKRTRSIEYMYKSEVKPYKMLCSMGNGFCFPIETLTFAAICHACDAGTPGVDFSVYGDDIIVRKSVAGRVIEVLKHFGFSLNEDKTFVEGPFRESCGADWFSGEDVRPFTLDFALDRVENFFKFCNLTQRNKRTSEFFALVRAGVIAALPNNYRFIRPFSGPVDSAIDSLGDEHLTSPHAHYKNGVWEWKVLRHEPVFDFERMRVHQNEPWLMGVALNGALSQPYGLMKGSPQVSFRRQVRTKVARESYASTSNWLPPHPL